MAIMLSLPRIVAAGLPLPLYDLPSTPWQLPQSRTPPRGPRGSARKDVISTANADPSGITPPIWHGVTPLTVRVG